MADYEKIYFLLFNKITDALAELGECNYGEAADILKAAQTEAEKIYIDGENEHQGA